jgi:hypothetical protein
MSQPPINGVSCAKELNKWTVRLNGIFVDDYGWLDGGERRARRVAMALLRALRTSEGA